MEFLQFPTHSLLVLHIVLVQVTVVNACHRHIINMVLSLSPAKGNIYCEYFNHAQHRHYRTYVKQLIVFVVQHYELAYLLLAVFEVLITETL